MWGEVIVHHLAVSQQVGQLAQRRGELSCVRGRGLPCCAWKGAGCVRSYQQRVIVISSSYSSLSQNLTIMSPCKTICVSVCVCPLKCRRLNGREEQKVQRYNVASALSGESPFPLVVAAYHHHSHHHHHHHHCHDCHHPHHERR